MTKPFFSILMPTYNQAEFIPAAIDSVLAQTFTDFELVIVNDGSNDDTSKIMERYAGKDSRVKIFEQKNGGTGSALNHAASKAKANWVCWLSSDDFFLPQHLERKADLIEENPEIRFIHSAAQYLIEEKQQIISPPADVPPPSLQPLRLLRINYVNGITITARTEEVREIKFNERLRYAQDYAMWLALALREGFAYIKEPLSITRIHKGQGTYAAPLGGLLDGAFVGLDVLNNHRFSEFTKFANLDDEEVLKALVTEALLNIADPKSYLKIAGFTSVMAARLAEWIDEDLDQERRVLVEGYIEEFIAAYHSVLDDYDRLLLASLADPQGEFRKFDGRLMLENQIEKYVAHRAQDIATQFENYLERFSAF